MLQLLAVQPSSSYRLLPEPYHFLMCSPASPVLDFYPSEFRVDMEGKRECSLRSICLEGGLGAGWNLGISCPAAEEKGGCTVAI